MHTYIHNDILYMLFNINIWLLGEGIEGEIELDYDLDYQISENHVYEPDVNTSHHSEVGEVGVEEIEQNYECPECGQNFNTKCDIRIHLGR